MFYGIIFCKKLGFILKKSDPGIIPCRGKYYCYEYEMIYEDLLFFLTNNGELKLKVSGITIDFEQTQINALKKIFPNVPLIGIYGDGAELIN